MPEKNISESQKPVKRLQKGKITYKPTVTVPREVTPEPEERDWRKRCSKETPKSTDESSAAVSKGAQSKSVPNEARKSPRKRYVNKYSSKESIKDIWGIKDTPAPEVKAATKEPAPGAESLEEQMEGVLKTEFNHKSDKEHHEHRIYRIKSCSTLQATVWTRMAADLVISMGGDQSTERRQEIEVSIEQAFTRIASETFKDIAYIHAMSQLRRSLILNEDPSVEELW